MAIGGEDWVCMCQKDGLPQVWYDLSLPDNARS
jgi:hypothetical protein